MADATAIAPRAAFPGLDKLGILVALLGLWGAVLPYAVLRPNRIVLGEGRSLLMSLPPVEGAAMAAIALLALLIALFRTPLSWRLAAGLAATIIGLVMIGRAGTYLTPLGNTLARVSPASGFWMLQAAFGLLAIDALTRLKLGPLMRVGLLAAFAAVIALLLWTGAWGDLSILKEYANRADAFWREARTHLLLASGALFAACLAGIPLGILCHRVPRLRATTLNLLNMIQTIPSIALFGLLIAPLAFIAASVPGASAIGISGIGAAPALVALFAYSLLPVVANTVVGLAGVPEAANDAARGMGMTDAQRLFGVELPLAFPVILTGIRIVLVQNIGVATIAALIGGGGFGVFVFQGIGQTAMDLVLLGALPTVALAMSSAILLDALIEAMSRRGGAR